MFSDVGEVPEVGDAATASGVERSGDVGAVELELDTGDSASALTTSQPSADSEVEDESEDTVLKLRSTAECIAVPGRDCARLWSRSRSRSFPFKEPKRRFTPKLSLRLPALLGGDGLLLSVPRLSGLWALWPCPMAVVNDRVTLLAQALGILKNVDMLGD